MDLEGEFLDSEGALSHSLSKGDPWPLLPPGSYVPVSEDSSPYGESSPLSGNSWRHQNCIHFVVRKIVQMQGEGKKISEKLLQKLQK